MSTPSTLPYRHGVGIMLFNREGRVFVAKRIDTVSEAWQMPQGGIDDGEEPYPAALRELGEETGVAAQYVTLLGELPDWLPYDLPADLIPKVWGGKYRGQLQKWYALRLDAPDTVINIATEHPEFSQWQWIAPEALPDIIVPFKRALYAHLLETLAPLAKTR